MAAVCEGRMLKYPNRDLEAIISASAVYCSCNLEAFDIGIIENVYLTSSA
jgi:hypothetical protein